jgi:S-formylglutathione hydrolase FrmB
VTRALVAAAVLAALLPRPAAAATDCAPPRCLTLRIPVPLGLNVPDSHVRILLPAGYDRSRRRYPVLYLLHGVGDTYATWTTNTDLVAFSRAFPVIIVTPDGGRGSDAGWYSDWKDGSRQWEAFHTRVLIPYVERTFRTNGRSAIGGNSMGGFGAMSYAARHPGLFRAAASLSGFVDTLYGAPASGPVEDAAGRGVDGQSLGTPRREVWGDQTTDEATWRAHNPTDLAARLRGTWLYIASGDGEPGGAAGDNPGKPYAYGEEQLVYRINQSFVGALDAAHVEHAEHFYAGYHDWPYWQAELHRVLPMIAAVLERR